MRRWRSGLEKDVDCGNDLSTFFHKIVTLKTCIRRLNTDRHHNPSRRKRRLAEEERRREAERRRREEEEREKERERELARIRERELTRRSLGEAEGGEDEPGGARGMSGEDAWQRRAMLSGGATPARQRSPSPPRTGELFNFGYTFVLLSVVTHFCSNQAKYARHTIYFYILFRYEASLGRCPGSERGRCPAESGNARRDGNGSLATVPSLQQEQVYRSLKAT